MKTVSILAITGFLALSGAAGAATIGFSTQNQTGGPYAEDGLMFDDIRIVSGKCTSPSGPSCGAFNDNDVSMLTAIDGGTFTISSLWFQLVGRGQNNTLHLRSDLGSALNLSVSDWGRNDGGQVIDLASISGFSGMTWLQIFATGRGNARIDNLSVAPVPVPAAGLMLLAALGGLALLRGRRTLPWW